MATPNHKDRTREEKIALLKEDRVVLLQKAEAELKTVYETLNRASSFLVYYELHKQGDEGTHQRVRPIFEGIQAGFRKLSGSKWRISKEINRVAEEQLTKDQQSQSKAMAAPTGKQEKSKPEKLNPPTSQAHLEKIAGKLQSEEKQHNKAEQVQQQGLKR